MKSRSRYPVYFVCFGFLLLLSIHGVKYLPVWTTPGLDFLNLHAFHHQCPEWPIPYAKNGGECGDPLGRPMLYPPLLYWLMAWVRFFDFSRALALWSAAIPIFTVLATGTVVYAGRLRGETIPRFRNLALWLLVFLQLPMAYSLERGNNDAALLPIYALAILTFVQERYFWSGVLLAAACWMKVYPVIPSAVLMGALALQEDLRRKSLAPIVTGFVSGGVILGLVLLPDSFRYVFTVLPSLMAEKGGFGTSSHSLYRGAASLFLKLPVLGLWIWATARLLRRDPVLALAAGLAISTFFQGISNDYNLITAYPFLLLVIERFLRKDMRALDFGLLVLTFLAFVGDRTPFEMILGNRAALFPQILWFIVFPLYLTRREAH